MKTFENLEIGDTLFLILPNYKVEETIITDLIKQYNYIIFHVKYLNGTQRATKMVPLSLLRRTYELTAATNKHDANMMAKFLLSIENMMHRKKR